MRGEVHIIRSRQYLWDPYSIFSLRIDLYSTYKSYSNILSNQPPPLCHGADHNIISNSDSHNEWMTSKEIEYLLNFPSRHWLEKETGSTHSVLSTLEVIYPWKSSAQTWAKAFIVWFHNIMIRSSLPRAK